MDNLGNILSFLFAFILLFIMHDITLLIYLPIYSVSYLCNLLFIYISFPFHIFSKLYRYIYIPILIIYFLLSYIILIFFCTFEFPFFSINSLPAYLCKYCTIYRITY